MFYQGCQFGCFKLEFEFLAFLTHLAFFRFQKNPDKIWVVLAFFSRNSMALANYCLSCIFLTNLFWREYMTIAGCKEYCKDFTVALEMFDIFHKKQMHDNVITRKKMLLQIGTASYPCFWWVIISILCLFIRFMCIRLKTAIWLFSTFWDKVWLFLVNTGWWPRCSTAVKKNCFVQIVCHCTPTNYVVQVKYTPTGAPLRCLLYNRAHRIYHYIPRNEIKMFTHIKLPIWSEHLMPWWESISMPLFNDVHLYPTFLSAHFNWLIPLTNLHFSPM